MKVCFLMPNHVSAGLGGAEVQVHFIMDYMHRRANHEIPMICRNSNAVQESGAQIYRTSSIRPLARHFMSADYRSVRRLLKQLRPDVVYTRTSTAYVGLAAQYCRNYRKRLVYHIAHIDDVRPVSGISFRSLPKRMERMIYEYGLRRADQIIAQTNEQAESLYENYGLRCSAVIRNFHPVPLFVEKPDGPIKIIWVANLKPAKRPELFVDLARRFLDRDDVEFLMIGAIQSRKYSGFLAEAGLPGNLSYLGPLPLEEVNQHLQGSHLLFNTSAIEGEGFPNTFIQQWQRGMPVVSMDVNPDGLLTPDSTGTACGGSFTRMVETVATLIGSPERMRRAGREAYSITKAEFGERQCEDLVGLLERET